MEWEIIVSKLMTTFMTLLKYTFMQLSFVKVKKYLASLSGHWSSQTVPWENNPQNLFHRGDL